MKKSANILIKQNWFSITCNIIRKICLYVYLLLGILFMCWLLFFDSTEFVKSQEKDLEKYPELQTFLFEYNDFYSDTCDIESGDFCFYFSSKCKNSDELFLKVDKRAIETGWHIIDKSEKSRTYSQNLKRYPAQTKNDIIILKYIPEKKLYHIKWH